jgi:hypothetical protein
LENRGKIGDSNQLLAPGIILIYITLLGPLLFVFATFGTPSGDSADAASKEGLHFAQKDIVDKKAAGSRMQAQAFSPRSQIEFLSLPTKWCQE